MRAPAYGTFSKLSTVAIFTVVVACLHPASVTESTAQGSSINTPIAGEHAKSTFGTFGPSEVGFSPGDPIRLNYAYTCRGPKRFDTTFGVEFLSRPLSDFQNNIFDPERPDHWKMLDQRLEPVRTSRGSRGDAHRCDPRRRSSWAEFQLPSGQRGTLLVAVCMYQRSTDKVVEQGFFIRNRYDIEGLKRICTAFRVTALTVQSNEGISRPCLDNWDRITVAKPVVKALGNVSANVALGLTLSGSCRKGLTLAWKVWVRKSGTTVVAETLIRNLPDNVNDSALAIIESIPRLSPGTPYMLSACVRAPWAPNTERCGPQADFRTVAAAPGSPPPVDSQGLCADRFDPRSGVQIVRTEVQPRRILVSTRIQMRDTARVNCGRGLRLTLHMGRDPNRNPVPVGSGVQMSSRPISPLQPGGASFMSIEAPKPAQRGAYSVAVCVKWGGDGGSCTSHKVVQVNF